MNYPSHHKSLSCAWITTFAQRSADNATSLAGGVSFYARRLRDAVSELGICVTVEASREEGSEAEQDVHRSWQREAPWSLVVAVLKRRPLLHVQHEVFMYGGIGMAVFLPVMLFIRRILRIGKTVVTMHGVPDTVDVTPEFLARYGIEKASVRAVRLAFQFIFRILTVSSNHVIVHEEILANRLREIYGAYQSQVTVMPLPLFQYAAAPTPQVAREILGVSGKHVFLFFGFVNPYKGLDVLLQAWEEYTRNNKSDELIIAGGMSPRRENDAAYLAYYETLKSSARHLPQVKWLGFAQDDAVPALFAATDVLVLPYRELLAASGPLGIAAHYGTQVLCSEALRPIAPRGTPVAKLDAIELCAGMHAALKSPIPKAFAEWRDVRTFDQMAIAHAALYERLTNYKPSCAFSAERRP